MSRLILAFKSFFGLLFGGAIPDDVLLELGLTKRSSSISAKPAAPAPAAPQKPAMEPAKPADGAVQVLSLLQVEARLVDFLLEDITPYTDDQVGAAIRDVHKNCRTVLDRCFKIVPVIDGVEGTLTRLATVGLNSQDTSRVKVIGKVPPDGKVEAGTLRHRGWKVESVALPPLRAGERMTVLAPAEIEVE